MGSGWFPSGAAPARLALSRITAMSVEVRSVLLTHNNPYHALCYCVLLSYWKFEGIVSHCGNSGDDRQSKEQKIFCFVWQSLLSGDSYVGGQTIKDCTEGRLIWPAAGISFEKFIILIIISHQGTERGTFCLAPVRCTWGQLTNNYRDFSCWDSSDCILFWKNGFKCWLFYTVIWLSCQQIY